MKTTLSEQGFTLVELLVVLAILGFLTMAALFATNDANEQARATAIVSQLREIDKAFAQYRISNRVVGWPEMNQTYVTHWQNDIDNMVNSNASWNNFAGLGNYLSEPADYTGAEYSYFGRASSVHICEADNPGLYNTNPRDAIGVAIRIDHQDPGLFAELDRIIDGGDGATCGRMRILGGSGSVYYSLAESIEGGSSFD